MRSPLPALVLVVAACAAREEAAGPGLPDGGASLVDAGGPDAGVVPRRPWVTAYYASWMADTLPVADVDFTAITHLAHFGWMPRAADGELEGQWAMSDAQSRAVVAAAHAGGRKALLVVGGAWTRDGFLKAIAPARVDRFVRELVEGVVRLGYDGVDLDMEPLEDADAAPYGAFVGALRTALDAAGPGLLLTTAAGWNGTVLAPLLGSFDQVNLMTYDLAGDWPGWETWHNSPLHDAGLRLASTGAPLPSVEGLVTRALATGARREKLGIGISFYGYVWKGASGPNQPIAGVEVDANKSYAWIMDRFYDPGAVRWHAGVEAPYLSVTTEARPKFVSYEDERSIAAKLAWARAEGLGGAIVWELGGGWRPGQLQGKRDVLLQAVKSAAFP